LRQAERLDLKRQRMETLRQRAAQLLDPGALVAVAAAAQMKQPELPVSEPAFAVLGKRREIESALLGLWYEWRRSASHRTDKPDAQWYLSYSLDDRLGNKRRGRDALRRRAAVSFAVCVVVCDHPPEKRKVGGSTPPLTTLRL
jgi:hypothetical protein